MIPALKVYNIDYSFIISNYLNKELWKKQWNLFIYKDHVFTLNLATIDTRTDSITFQIKYNKLVDTWDGTQNISYYLNSSTIQVLKQQINGAIFRLMEKYDEYLCKETSGYKELSNLYYEEKDKLREIAESYLDDCGISQDDIREAYIDRYVSNNSKFDIHKTNYISAHRYLYLTELLLIFTKITNDKNRFETISRAIQDDSYIKKLELEINEFSEYFGTEDYDADMEDNLESI